VEIHLWFFAKKTAFFVNLKNINSKNAFNSNILIFRTLVVTDLRLWKCGFSSH